MQAVVAKEEECKINRHNFEIFAELIARISHSLWMRDVLPFTMPPPPATAAQDDTLMPQFTHKHIHKQIHRGQDRTGTTEPRDFYCRFIYGSLLDRVDPDGWYEARSHWTPQSVTVRAKATA